MTKGTGGRGLVLVVPNTAIELYKEKSVCEKIMAQLEWISKIVGVKTIAIAGQGPGIFVRHGLNLTEPFVRGNKGTAFCVLETVSRVIKEHSLIPGNIKIALVGVGYVGKLVLKEMRHLGHEIVGIDIDRNIDDVILLDEGGKDALSKSDMVIVLTPKESDFVPFLKSLKKGCIVIDDTHPKMIASANGIHFYKVAVGMEGVEFKPRLPGYKSNWIPGCALEAIYSA